MAEHTPGPWMIERSPSGWGPYLVDANGVPVGSVFDHPIDVIEANVALAAAAPELLAAAKLALLWISGDAPDEETLGDGSFEMSCLRGAIAKMESRDG